MYLVDVSMCFSGVSIWTWECLVVMCAQGYSQAAFPGAPTHVPTSSTQGSDAPRHVQPRVLLVFVILATVASLWAPHVGFRLCSPHRR